RRTPRSRSACADDRRGRARTARPARLVRSIRSHLTWPHAAAGFALADAAPGEPQSVAALVAPHALAFRLGGALHARCRVGLLAVQLVEGRAGRILLAETL